MKAFTEAIVELPEVVGVQSMTKGPGSYKNARKSPLCSVVGIIWSGKDSD